MTRDIDYLTGEEAVEAMCDRWDTLGMGKVEAEYIQPYLIIGRSGADWRVFISLADDTVVLVEDADATTRHIPEDERAEDDVGKPTLDALSTAFDNAAGGMFPIADEGAFAIPFMQDGERKRLEIPFDVAGHMVEDAG